MGCIGRIWMYTLRATQRIKRRLEDWAWEWAEIKGLQMSQEGGGAAKVSNRFLVSPHFCYKYHHPCSFHAWTSNLRLMARGKTYSWPNSGHLPIPLMSNRRGKKGSDLPASLLVLFHQDYTSVITKFSMGSIRWGATKKWQIVHR